MPIDNLGTEATNFNTEQSAKYTAQASSPFAGQNTAIQEAQSTNPATQPTSLLPGYRAVSSVRVPVSTPTVNTSVGYRGIDTVKDSIDRINSLYEQQSADTGGTYGSQSAGSAYQNGKLSSSRNQLINNAKSYLGTDYQLGGTTYKGIDCSGLVMQVYNKMGFNITQHSAGWQGRNIPGVRTSINNLRPGDIVAWKDGSHIAIWAGNGQIIEAANPRVGTVQRRLWADPSQVIGIAVRLPGE